MSSVATKRRNPDAAPINQTEFYRHYFAYVCRFVVKYGGIRPQDAEDVANSIWVRLLARDVLSQFDPDRVIIHDGKRYPARFENYLAKMLDLYVRHYRVQQGKRMAREVCVSLDEDTDIFETLLGSTTDASFYDELQESMLVDQLTKYLRRVPRRANDPLDLERLFLCVVAQARVFGKLNVRELAEALEVTQGCVRGWLTLLRTHIRNALEGRELEHTADVVPRDTRMTFGGVLVGLDDLEAAQAALADCASNMIKQPLAKVGNPLAACDYHAVASEYRNRTGFESDRPRHAEKEAFVAALAEAIALYYVPA